MIAGGLQVERAPSVGWNDDVRPKRGKLSVSRQLEETFSSEQPVKLNQYGIERVEVCETCHLLAETCQVCVGLGKGGTRWRAASDGLTLS